jgi:hypothetical protein
LGELALAGLPPARPWFVLRSAVGEVSECVSAFMDFLAADAAAAASDVRA